MTTHLTDKNGTTTPARKEGAKMTGPARPAPVKKDGPISRISRYLQEVRSELKKTTWPNREKLIASTKVVLGAVVVVGLYLWVIDLVLSFLMGWLVQTSAH